MKILLDECLPVDLRHHFTGHQVHTVQWAGLKGTDNGELLRAAGLLGYDALLTVDQGMPQGRGRGGREPAVVLINTRTNQMEDLLTLVDSILEALKSIKPGEVIRIPEPV